MEATPIQTDAAFSPEERDAVYKCIFGRRNMRGPFLPDPVPEEVLGRILRAAHRAPSVESMQPWDFVVAREPSVKRRVRDAFALANEEAAAMLEDERAQRYRMMKFQGIVEAPVGLCVTCDRSRTGPVVLGRTHQAEMDL